MQKQVYQVVGRKGMTNLDAIKKQDAEQIADMMMQFINVSKFATTSKEAIIEWLNSDDLFLPFKSGETE
jgi:hypothetical protein